MTSTTCSSCGAPLPLVFGKRADRCEYCRAVQPPESPPAAAPGGGFAPRPPQVFGPPIGFAPVGVQPKQGNAGCVISIVALVFVVLAGVGAAFFVFAARSSAGVSASEPSREKTPDRSRPTPARAPAPPPPPSVDYFQSAESVGTAIAARFTPNAELRELVLYTGYAIFELRDPAKRENVDRYVLRPSGYDEPRPVTVSGRDKSQLDAATFRLSEVRFALVPQLVADAKIRIPVADGQVSHIIIDKFFPFRKALGFRVYIRSERQGGGYVSYDAAGKMLKVQK